MKILISESQFNRIINELSLSHQDGYALIDGKPYKIKKGIFTVNVDKLILNKDGSATLIWSAPGYKNKNELISRDTVDKIVNALITNKQKIYTITTKMGDVDIVQKN